MFESHYLCTLIQKTTVTNTDGAHGDDLIWSKLMFGPNLNVNIKINLGGTKLPMITPIGTTF